MAPYDVFASPEVFGSCPVLFSQQQWHIFSFSFKIYPSNMFVSSLIPTSQNVRLIFVS